MSNFMVNSEILAEKKQIRSIFSDFWFVIPEYQRAYVWESDNINELLDDLWFAYNNRNESEYFLGSLVLRYIGKYFPEYEVLDGQQRLTTLFMLIAVLRDISENQDLIDTYKGMIYQKENVFKGIPERIRIIYNIRDNVGEFINNFILKDKATLNIEELKEKTKIENISISNMAKAIITIHEFFKDKTSEDIEKFAMFLCLKVIFIYVSTNNREDAFRLFTILNNRGIPLTNADILKSINIGEIKDENLNKKYAKMWEDIEGNLGEDFDRFLSFIRTILIKDKARVNLLEEFEEQIYKKGLLQKGKASLDLIKKYKDIYDTVLKFENLDICNEYKNLITIMQIGLPSGDWIPPLMYYYNKYLNKKLLDFLERLEFKFSSDWILQKNPTDRIENMNKILKAIEKSSNCEDVINNEEIFQVEKEELRYILNLDVYGRRFARYILLKYEYLISENTVHLSDYKTISVEHILPQNPPEDSKWRIDFTEEDRLQWTHKLANLVLISMRKNSKLSNLDFEEKKKKYLESRIDVFNGSKIFINQNSVWNVDVLRKRQEEMLDKLI